MEEQKNKLYVGNLPYSVTDESLKEIFSKAGEVTEAVVISDKFTKRSKGFGFVTMIDEEAANKAVADFNEQDVEGRKLRVSIAKPFRPKNA